MPTRTIHITQTFTVLVLSILLSLFLTSDSMSQKWETAKQEAGIKVYKRLNGEKGSREIRAEMLLPIHPEQGVALIKDEARATEWIHRMETFDLLSEENDSTWFTYGKIAIPWPISDKDVVSKNTLHKIESGYQINIESRPDRIERKPKLNRITDSNGFWRFDSVGSDSTKVTYQIYAQSESILPEWLLNMVVVNSVVKTFEGMQGMLSGTTSD